VIVRPEPPRYIRTVRPDHQPTILVVDDDERVAALVAEMVSIAEYHPVKAVCPEQAIRVFESVGSEIDVLLTDFQMPGMNGVELIRALRSRRPGLAAVIMTGYASSLAHGYDVLEKPFGMTALEAALARALKREAAAEPDAKSLQSSAGYSETFPF
jgi:DNA-binding NtrC family response regulator